MLRSLGNSDVTAYVLFFLLVWIAGATGLVLAGIFAGKLPPAILAIMAQGRTPENGGAMS